MGQKQDTYAVVARSVKVVVVVVLVFVSPL